MTPYIAGAIVFAVAIVAYVWSALTDRDATIDGLRDQVKAEKALVAKAILDRDAARNRADHNSAAATNTALLAADRAKTIRRLEADKTKLDGDLTDANAVLDVAYVRGERGRMQRYRQPVQVAA